MKFSLFAHMERLDPNQDMRRLHAEFLELCDMAEDAGFEAIWTGEHHGMNFTIAPNPFLNLVDLARRTSRVRLGTGTIVAPFWHPIKLAGEAAMTDILCDGRLEIGLARGAYNFEYQRLGGGMDAWRAGQHLREIVPAIQGLWRGDYEHTGDCWRFPTTTSTPKPLQEPHPPIWIAARDPNSHSFAVANGCNVQVTPLWQGDEEVESLMERFETACAEHPERPRPKIMVLRHTYIGEDEADLRQAAQDLSRYYCYFGAWFKNERPVTQGSILALAEEEMAGMEMFSPDKMRRQNVVGTPEEVTARLKHYEALGYDQYALWIDSLMPFERKKASLRRFIDQVMPAFS
jgi:alkanesulfonate monooxygenase SsuD/methylene tetrahydromethanopterin reductase-like flavin-dependent oxidoreductase (luciferase family)